MTDWTSGIVPGLQLLAFVVVVVFLIVPNKNQIRAWTQTRIRENSGVDFTPRRILSAVILIALIIAGPPVAQAIQVTYFVGGTNGPAPHDTTGLGVWNNMPAALTELMGNTSYRAVLVVASPGTTVNVYLSVGCLMPSNTVGAQLTLQYANYTGDPSTHANATNFINISGTVPSVPIDNSAGWPCPGVLTHTVVTSLSRSSTTNGGWIFRVMGSGGGGTGDNPRFSFVGVVIRVLFNNLAWGTNVLSPATTGFTAAMFRPVIVVGSAVVVNFNWLAVNSTVSTPTSESGTGSCTVAFAASSCSQAITFTIAFPATPNVFLQPTTSPTSGAFPLGMLNLLQAETVTV